MCGYRKIPNNWKSHLFTMKAHGRMAVRFHYIIYQSQQELCQQSQRCHVTRPVHAHPANKRPEEPQSSCIWDQKHQRVLYQNSFLQHDRFALPRTGCCFQFFGIDHDASYTHYLHPPKCTHRVSHQALQQGIKPSAAQAAPTQLTGFTACLPRLCSPIAVSLPGQHYTQGLTSAVLAA